MVSPTPKVNPDDKEKKRSKGNYKNLSPFIYRLFKKHRKPDYKVSFSKKSMSMIEELTLELFTILTDESRKLLQYSQKKTLQASEIKTAIKLLVPETIQEKCLKYCDNSVSKYIKSLDKNN